MQRHYIKAVRAALLAVCTVWAVAACSAAGAPSPAASHSMGADTASSAPMPASDSVGTIHIMNYAFTGSAAAPAGARLAVMNMDAEAHSVTADDGSFDVTVPAGQTVTFTVPAKPGTYPYHCKYHADMHGTLALQ